MKENVKNTTKALYTMCICLIVVMGILFLGNSLTKGTYSAGTVLTKDTKYCSKSGDIVSGSKCCPSGYAVATGGALCCPTGYNKLDSVNSLCSNSKGNTKNAEQAYNAKTCKAGNILNGNTCTINSASTSCPPGQYYFDQSSQPLKCETCRPGTYCPGGTEAAVACEPGYYCPESGLSAQVKCPPDKPNSKGYSKSINDCYASSSGSGGTSGAGCYNVGNAQGNHYVWLDKAPSHGTLVADSYCKSKDDNKKYTYTFYTKDGSFLGKDTCEVDRQTTYCKSAITPPSCSGQWSGQKNCPTNSVKVGPNFFGNTDNLIGDSSWYCCEGSSGSDSSSSTPPIPEPPTTSSTSSNPPTSTPTSTPSSNVDENPKTGSIAIFMVWVIAIGTLIYSIAYFKQSKFE